MALEKQITIDKIEVVINGVVQVRQATAIFEDGKELSKTYHRWVLTPDMDISDQEQKVQDIANAAWTPAVKAAYEAFKAEQANKLK